MAQYSRRRDSGGGGSPVPWGHTQLGGRIQMRLYAPPSIRTFLETAAASLAAEVSGADLGPAVNADLGATSRAARIRAILAHSPIRAAHPERLVLREDGSGWNAR